jgi:hypothetical protein
MTSGVILSNELRIAIVALVIENHPMIEAGRLRNKMPLTDDSSFVTVLLQYLGQSLL